MIHRNDAVGPIVLAWPNAGDRGGTGGKAAGDDAAAGGMTGLISPSAEAKRQVFRDWRHWRGSTCEFLILRVLRKEHANLRVELHNLRTLAAASAERHHGNRPEIPIIGELVEQLAVELAAHMDIEETTVFPVLLEVELAYVGEISVSTAPRGVGQLLKSMSEQHQRTRRTLTQLRRESNDFRSASTDGFLDREFYAQMASLDCGLRSDFRLENAVLFPRVAQMESELLRGSIGQRPA
ncbi:MAG TPA: hemerythrin domain-containing protein [Acidobacteriaceae bacterium]|nr:hemerythrin domain-containing protein [Acidobacteriaceae bacterium]